jgi:hypothetical protein
LLIIYDLIFLLIYKITDLFRKFNKFSAHVKMAVEANNYRLNTVIWPHKNIWTFIKKIKIEESVTQIKFLRIENESFRKRERNSKDLKRFLKISEFKVSYLSNKITLNEYLDKISNYAISKFKK